jgi:tRNA (adenine37-N6)-methyltransferase
VQGLVLTVRALDALDGSPVLDIKPVFAEFLPERGSVRQPAWSHEMMAKYFASEKR